ncbi:MAG: diguanylate cyclase domain-containing protein, partial [Bacillota bacterium]
ASVYLNKPFTKNELKHNIAIILRQDLLKKKLNQKMNFFSGLFECSTEGIIMFNKDFIIKRANNRYKYIFNYKNIDLISNDLRNFTTSHIPFKTLKENLLENNYFSIEQELIFDSKESMYFLIKGIPIYDKDTFKGGYLKYINITELKRKEKEIKYISEHDSMTDLLNRRAFDNKLDEIINNKDLKVSLIIGDIDKLKQINDTSGHSTGDKVIKLAAKTLKESFPSDAIISRIGGDEFGIILINKDQEKSVEYCNIINRKFKEYIANSNIKRDVSISLGCSRGNNKNKEILFNKADQEMYKIKKNLV